MIEELLDTKEFKKLHITDTGKVFCNLKIYNNDNNVYLVKEVQDKKKTRYKVTDIHSFIEQYTCKGFQPKHLDYCNEEE